MRIRDRLARIKSIALRAQLATYVLFVAALFAWGVTEWDPCLYVAFVALAGLLGSVLFGKHGARCPRCRGNVGSRTQYFGEKTSRWFRRIDFCLFCGVSLDEPDTP
jgi:hypothetical protein